MDLFPTFLDLIDVSLPAEGSKVLHRGKAVHPVRGQSWKKFITDGTRVDPNDEFALWSASRAIGWELHSQAALKKGQYKIVFIRTTHGGKAVVDDDPSGWELFNVTLDPGETTDISDQEPEKLKELLGDWEQYVKETGLVWGPNAMEPGLSAEDAPHLHEVDLELQRTWLQTPHGARPGL